MAKYIKLPFTVVDAFRYTGSPASRTEMEAWLLEKVAGIQSIAAGDVIVVDAQGRPTKMIGPEFDAMYGPSPDPKKGGD